jgi:hypothetical protein
MPKREGRALEGRRTASAPPEDESGSLEGDPEDLSWLLAVIADARLAVNTSSPGRIAAGTMGSTDSDMVGRTVGTKPAFPPPPPPTLLAALATSALPPVWVRWVREVLRPSW